MKQFYSLHSIELHELEFLKNLVVFSDIRKQSEIVSFYCETSLICVYLQSSPLLKDDSTKQKGNKK